METRDAFASALWCCGVYGERRVCARDGRSMVKERDDVDDEVGRKRRCGQERGVLGFCHDFGKMYRIWFQCLHCTP